jgi:predicted amidohydrolase YtcJ
VRILVLVSWVLALVMRAEAAGSRPAIAADVVLTGGKVWTANTGQPEVDSLAIWRGRILAAGTKEQLGGLVGPATRVIDLEGRRVVPGLYDSHAHLLMGGRQLGEVQLRDAKDEAEFGRRLRAFDQKTPPGRWIQGEWDHDRTLAGRLPSAALLDEYAPDHPLFLKRYDGHMAVVNQKALQLAKITHGTPDPEGGVIDRKPGGKEPTGVLRNKAMDLVSALVPDPSDDEVAEAMRAALEEARRAGVTSVEDMGMTATETKKVSRFLCNLASKGDLTLRVELYRPLEEWKSLEQWGIDAGFGDDWVRIGGVKGYVDGSLGSRTAKMFEPYSKMDDPKAKDTTGIFVTSPTKLREMIKGADLAGLIVAVHSIGDRANAEMLDIFAETARANGARDRRFRLEHAQLLRSAEYKRFKELDVIASMQPYHIIDDGRWAEERIGAARCAASYACRSLLDAGAHLAFGSDWPVAPLNPLLGIDAAVNRRTLDGKNPNGWFPKQKITVAEALVAYTIGAAYAAHQETDRGSLESGKLADLVVLSRDILAPEEQNRITQTEVLLTMVGGKVVYEKAKR